MMIKERGHSMSKGYWKLIEEGDGWDSHYDIYEWYEVDEEGYEIATGRTMRKPSKWNAESSYNHW